MDKKSVYSLRLPNDMAAQFDGCPGVTRSDKIIRLIKFAFDRGYPGPESSPDLTERVEALEKAVKALQQPNPFFDESEDIPF